MGQGSNGENMGEFRQMRPYKRLLSDDRLPAYRIGHREEDKRGYFFDLWHPNGSRMLSRGPFPDLASLNKEIHNLRLVIKDGWRNESDILAKLQNKKVPPLYFTLGEDRKGFYMDILDAKGKLLLRKGPFQSKLERLAERQRLGILISRQAHAIERATPKAKRPILKGDGKICRKCNNKMQRREHPTGWRPKPGQPYFFAWWDVCGCGHIQHYEAAKTPCLSN
jgi:hypothetical protein